VTPEFPLILSAGERALRHRQRHLPRPTWRRRDADFVIDGGQTVKVTHRKLSYGLDPYGNISCNVEVPRNKKTTLD
jgi:hypothetical protein